jgi:hypothetical protein
MNRAELHVLLRLYLLAVLVFYGSMGFNFLLLGNVSTIVREGGILASPAFWSWAFLIPAFLLLQSLLQPALAILLRLALLVTIGTATGWLVIRTAIVLQTHLDYTAPVTWCFILSCHFFAVRVASRLGLTDAVLIPPQVLSWWPALWRRLRQKAAP